MGGNRKGIPWLLFVGYFVIDLFHTEKAETPNGLTTTDYLNPELPDANMKGDGIGNKYDNMLKSYGKIDDHIRDGHPFLPPSFP